MKPTNESRTYPERIADYAAANFPPHQADEVMDQLIDAATGNREGTEEEYRLLNVIFPEHP